MSTKHSTRTPTHEPGPAADAPYPSNDVGALLIEVLRNVNREVQTTLALDGKALAAVQRFQAISRDLRTLADGPSSGFSNSSGLRAR